ncbi:MAG: hypothetical protein KAU14_06870 [Thermoplasmata archaeon]|nr:hypothetical protein [Thermoplasmata archaeon]
MDKVKGKLLYLSENDEIVDKDRSESLILRIGGIFGIICLSALILIFKDNIGAMILLFIALFFPILFIVSSFLSDTLKLYEKGITLPFRSLKNFRSCP